MEIKFGGKTALVTGAGKGIGRATALLLGQCGANVIALSRTQSDLDSLKVEMSGCNIKTICADLFDLNETIKAVESISDHIDFLVNNAAYCTHTPNVLDLTEEEINKAIKLNLTVPLRLSQVVARDLIKRGVGGAIVNVSSVVGERFCAHTTPYGFSKAALDNLTMVLAAELAPHKIRVNSILPGVTKTPIVMQFLESEAVQRVVTRTPRGQTAEPKEIAHTIVYLLSDFASNITGGKIVSDGGFLAN
ncbi:L-xylulose reductase-like [Dendronephthya gigantea]|uniref:L-xylulose reductase-like n=1 Tax=Dendronephthya gigantea TaxID=151771 RepID=UPI00106CDEB1|nr:L-xylulose reductase-like [Dendronephthya gigantea]